MRSPVPVRLAPLPRAGSSTSIRSVAATLIMFGSFLAACGDAGPGASRSSTLIVHVPNADEWLLSPAQADEPIFLAFLPIAQQGRDGGIEGRLARSWEHSDDYRRWTVHLRTDVRWHDGVPVTAQDVAFTADLLMHPDVARIPPGAFSVTVVDDSTYTVEIHTADERGAVTPTRAPTLAGIPFPKHLLETLDPTEFFEWEFWLRPVGNGPYRYLRHTPQTMVELEANPDFYLGEPSTARVVLRFSGENRLTELLSGNVDVALYMEWADLLKVQDDPRFRSYWTKDNWVFMGILWNVRHGPLADVRVRRALTMATDRRQLHRKLNLPEETKLIESVFTERQYWGDEMPVPLAYDPVGAEALLAQAGWIRQDGGWQRNGEPLAFTTTVMAEAGDAILQSAAIYVQDQLRDLGIDMRIELADPGVLRERANAGTFEAILGEVLTAPSPLAREFGAESYLGYDDARVAELIDRAGASIDPDATDRIYAEIGAILREDLPMTALFPDYEMHVVRSGIGGLSSPWRAVPLRHMEEVRLDGDSRLGRR
jgi:peptide/nickel transport system substrate-binding protein